MVVRCSTLVVVVVVVVRCSTVVELEARDESEMRAILTTGAILTVGAILTRGALRSLQARGEGGVRLGAANVGSLAGEISLFQGGVRGAMMVSTQPGAAVQQSRRSDSSDTEVRSNTAPSIGSCASSGRAWRHLAARDTQGERPGHWAPSHCLWCSNQPPPEPPIPPPPLTT